MREGMVANETIGTVLLGVTVEELAYRMARAERLILELCKHVPMNTPLPPGAGYAINELKERHPDV